MKYPLRGHEIRLHRMKYRASARCEIKFTFHEPKAQYIS